MDPNYARKFMVTQITNAIEATIKEFLSDLKSGMTITNIQSKWEKKLNPS